MKFAIKLLLKLLVQFVPVDDEDLPRILNKANDWASTVDPYTEGAENKTPDYLKKAGKFLDFWAVQVGLLFAYLFFYNELQVMFREKKSDDEKDND